MSNLIAGTQPRDLAQRLQEAYRGRWEAARAGLLSKALVVESRHQPAVVEQYTIQQVIRPLFGKGAPELPLIGAHPDFARLAGTRDVDYSPITTLFMDLE